MNKILVIFSLVLSSLVNAEVCEISLHSTPFKPGIKINSYVTVQCETLPGGTTEYATRHEAAEVYMSISNSWALAKWTVSQCASSTEGFKYSCKYESPKN